MPPPLPTAELSAMVELVTVSVPLVVRCRRRRAGRVVVDGGVGDRQRAIVEDAAAVAARRVAGDGGVGDRQRATVVDAAARRGPSCRRWWSW